MIYLLNSVTEATSFTFVSNYQTLTAMESIPPPPTSMATDSVITSCPFKLKERTQTHRMLVTLQGVHQAGWPCSKEHKKIQCSQDLTVPLLSHLHKPANSHMPSLCARCLPWPCIVIFLSSLSANGCQTVTSPLLSRGFCPKSHWKVAAGKDIKRFPYCI